MRNEFENLHKKIFDKKIFIFLKEKLVLIAKNIIYLFI